MKPPRGDKLRGDRLLESRQDIGGTGQGGIAQKPRGGSRFHRGLHIRPLPTLPMRRRLQRARPKSNPPCCPVATSTSAGRLRRPARGGGSTLIIDVGRRRCACTRAVGVGQLADRTPRMTDSSSSLTPFSFVPIQPPQRPRRSTATRTAPELGGPGLNSVEEKHKPGESSPCACSPPLPRMIRRRRSLVAEAGHRHAEFRGRLMTGYSRHSARW